LRWTSGKWRALLILVVLARIPETYRADIN
jgi:hypothetical protein